MNTRISNTDIEDNQNDLRRAITKLDEIVPTDGAWIQFNQYGGGPDEGQMLGNLIGYRRFGIELLTATLMDDDIQDFNVELEYLISEESTINFDWFELYDAPPETNHTIGRLDRLMPIGCMAIFVLATVVFLIGCGTIAQWIVG